ncbi:FecR family protein [Parapedobacter koreensis]|uniref:FecR family protein n=1 Tax=Parapedobacter koreensis TaxID=332977 RepID=A0A1H7JV57_9SPHI|nr:FecR domain-containing protein [Parapedobacter koreensis]SEK78234.1 FecR family protein [Parapedobacter koreensis]
MEIDHRLLEKYWSGRCTPEERTAVEAWMAEDTPDREYELHAPNGEEALKTQLWQGIQGERSSKQEEPEKKPAESYHRRLHHWLMPIGIAASLLIVTSLYLFKWSSITEHPGLSIAEYREIAVPYGRKMQVTLPDSTTVYLNAGSTLKYPVRFDGSRRHVLLEGEGFFEVTKNPEQPFIVETPYAAARVLGTRFNMRSRAPDQSSLTVEEGKVQFTAAGVADTLTLIANEQGIYNGKAMEQLAVNSRNYTAWKSGEIIFNGISLAEALPELERWYDVRITLQNPGLADYRVKASFMNASLSSVLHDLAFSMNINYTVKNKEVILYQ